MRPIKYRWKSFAKFHTWGQEDIGDGKVVTVAIIETSSGEIKTVEPRTVTFMDATPELYKEYLNRGET